MSKRPSLSLAVLCLATMALAACQDGSTMPAAPRSAEASAEAGSALRPTSKGPHLTIATSSVTTAVLFPTYDNVYISPEGHRIVIPANSVCLPGVSGYGPSTWNLPCQTATAPVIFTITSRTGPDGRPRIDVHPDVRFSPSKTVFVEFKDQAAAAAYKSLINYCPTGSSTCIDESKTDASLRTYVDKVTGKVSRRIKHFSGYHIILGTSCVVGSDPDCMDDGTGF